MKQQKRPGPISTSKIEIPHPVRFLTKRVMTELLTRGAIVLSNEEVGLVATLDLEKLRIVIMKAMAIAHRIGTGQPSVR